MSTATTVTESMLLTEAITRISWEQFERGQYIFPLLCNAMPSDKGAEEMGIYSGMGVFEAVGETDVSPESKPAAQWSKTFTHVEFRLKTPMSRAFLADQKWNYFSRLGVYAGNAATNTFDADTATLWNGSFASTLTADGLTLVNDAHLNKAGGNSQDNAETAALGVEGLRLATKHFDDLKDSVGNPMHGITLDKILVPTALKQDALELARANARPDTPAHNAPNLYQGLGVIVWNRLTTSATAWWGLNDMLLMDNSILLVREPPEFKGWGNPDNDVTYYGGYFRKSQGFLDWRGVFGSTGAG